MNTTQRLQLGTLPIRRLAEYAWNTATGSGLPVRPYYASMDVTYRCNLKCVHCSLWDRPEGEREMTLDEMKSAILKMKQWLKMPAIDILGGEAFLRRETMDVIRFAHDQGMVIHLTTNGTMFTDRICKELIELNVHKVAVSIDGIRSKTHDTTRGVNGALRITTKGVERLKGWKDKLGGDTRIAIHTIMDASTLNEIPDLLEWTASLGLDGYHLVPLDQNVGGIDYGMNGYNFEEGWFERNPLWIRDIPRLEAVVAHVIQKKRDGYPVADPISYLRDTIPYFRDPGGIQYRRPCRAGSELVKVTPKGEVTFCPYEPPVGDLATQTFEDIWVSPEAAAARTKINACTKKCFIPFCAWNETERVGRFFDQFVKKPKVGSGITVRPITSDQDEESAADAAASESAACSSHESAAAPLLQIMKPHLRQGSGGQAGSHPDHHAE
jgi:AdoMet-dependent heme synthase